MIVWRIKEEVYILSKLNKVISNLKYTTFKIILYYSQSTILRTFKNLLKKFDLKLDQLTHKEEVTENNKCNDKETIKNLKESNINEFKENEK